MHRQPARDRRGRARLQGRHPPRPALPNPVRESKALRTDSGSPAGRKDGMFLLDDALFRLWRNGLVDKEECLLKAAKPLELAARFLAAERGQLEEEEGDEDEDED